ncbi:MAG TPA: hypothetical protein VEY11_18080 [Pyrinomonadaceae bacterium]|nr:hypothetical protein [Pyrinomonadaceae bacterium]
MNDKTKAAVMAGLGIGAVIILMGLIGSVIPGVGCCNCLLPIAAGILAVYLYTKNSPVAVDPKDGAMLGAIAGVAGGLLNLIIGTPLSYFVTSAVMTAQLAQLRDQGFNLPESLTGFALYFVMGIVGAIFFVILATIGGLIGSAIFGKKGAGGVGGSTMPPPPGNYGGGAQPPAGGGYGGTQPPAGGGYGGGGGGTYGSGS